MHHAPSLSAWCAYYDASMHSAALVIRLTRAAFMRHDNRRPKIGVQDAQLNYSWPTADPQLTHHWLAAHSPLTHNWLTTDSPLTTDIDSHLHRTVTNQQLLYVLPSDAQRGAIWPLQVTSHCSGCPQGARYILVSAGFLEEEGNVIFIHVY